VVIDDSSDNHAFLTAWKTAMQGTLVVAGISRTGLNGAFDHLLQQRRVNRALPSGIRGIVAFTCVKTLCASCREIAPEAANNQRHSDAGAGFHAQGCPDCRYSGYGGKKFLVDVLPFDPELREVLASARESADLFSYLNNQGYHGIPEKLAEMLSAGEISPEEYQAALPQ
jgi:type IV pilus assembly protein PilB